MGIVGWMDGLYFICIVYYFCSLLMYSFYHLYSLSILRTSSLCKLYVYCMFPGRLYLFPSYKLYLPYTPYILCPLSIHFEFPLSASSVYIVCTPSVRFIYYVYHIPPVGPSVPPTVFVRLICTLYTSFFVRQVPFPHSMYTLHSIAST